MILLKYFYSYTFIKMYLKRRYCNLISGKYHAIPADTDASVELKMIAYVNKNRVSTKDLCIFALT